MAEFPFTARATLKYKSPPGSGSTLAFAKGDTLTVLSSDDDGDWFTGKLSDGTEGVFPSAFVERVEEQEEQSPAPAAVVEQPAPAPKEEEVPASSTTVDAPASAEPAEPAPAASAPVPVAAPSPPNPTRQPSLPPAQDTAASTTSNSPPEAPKKPGSLRDRIAALNAQGAGAGGPGPPPLPRAKPPAFKRAPIPTPVASSSSPEQPSVAVLSSSPPERSERGAVANPAFSAEDAKQSIGKGGSLKDRIAALQGMSLDTPGAPGRAPKPWKKKSVEVPTEEPVAEGEAASASTETEQSATKVAAQEEDSEGQVKDAPPAETETTAQSPGAEVPQFSPASPPSHSPAPDAHPFVAPPAKDDDDEESPAIGKSSTDNATSPAPVEATAEEDGQPVDEEVEKRKAIAARMADLGGQRVGMAMPALPKRAGPPRRRAPTAASPSAEEAPSPIVAAAEDSAKEVSSPTNALKTEAEAVTAPVEEPETLDESTPINEPASVEEQDTATAPAQDEEDSLDREVAEPVTLASNPLLAATKEQEEDDDDFETPVLPARDSDDEFDAPALPEASSPIVHPVETEEVERKPREDPQDEPEPIVAAPPLPPGRPAVPPPPPPPQPPRDDSDEEQVDDYDDEESAPKPDLSVETAHLDQEDAITDASPPPTSPATASRPAIPSIPASFAPPAAPPVKEAIVIPRSTEPEDDEEDDTLAPTSPATASRPAIPGIPASFAAPSAPARPAPIVPLRQPEEEEQGAEEEQFAATHTPQSEAVDSPMDPTLPPRGAPPAAPKSVPPPPPAVEDDGERSAPKEEAAAEGEQQDEDEEEEEEDPEVARRAALAARMAKLGGMNMRMGPMFPPIGGMRPPTKKKSVAEPVEESAPTEEAEEPAPPRRLPGIPTGGFALPGIVAPVRAPEPEPEEEEPVEQEDEQVAEPEVEEATEHEPIQEPKAEDAPPPLPAGRPSSMLPPRRSVPTPQATEHDQEDVVAPPPLPSGRPLPPQPQVAEQFVEEPETHEDFAQEVEEQAPPPPTRPQGGLPPVPTVATSPPLPPTASPPASPPSRRASLFKSSSKQGSTSSLDRQPTRTSMDSTRGLGVVGSGYLGDDTSPQRSNSSSGHPLPALPEGSGGFLAQDIDLEQGSQWWRATPFGPPSSIRSRRDILYDLSESTATKRGKTRFDNEIEVIYADLSKTIITISFDAADTSEATTSLSQTHHAPPSFSPAQLSQLSTTVGAQIFAAAHSKLSDKGAREQNGESLVNFCFGRATEPLGPRGWSYGANVLDIESGSKGKASVLNEVDEPRAGDVIVFHDTKFKHNLSTTRVGSAERPHVAVVAAWDGKKRKVKTIEVGSNGAVEEGGHRTEDLKSGRVSVWRVLPRDAV
ncbi:hypothetical protein BCR35DRAFT_305565 [Leucosporidium creatinivorum]|uniref:SH3 domain-containing protein n=1 Tax=Leucosporidium creatinivorum TaxID=106004 RepID=A0A1Y2F096_9BASI|nr:hypothetical protein BCR35DRAFT_305565 [Leucosporidium creatinivorum]